MRTRPGVAENFGATPIWGILPYSGCSSSVIIPRARLCGSASASSRPYTGVAQISCSLSDSNHSSRVFSRNFRRRNANISGNLSGLNCSSTYSSQPSTRHRLLQNQGSVHATLSHLSSAVA